ncbi:HET-domain-containing protein [Macroventuria anomochaeta]|uniref:HET-domain-containing protein n=1 Tax=Macroventuria anomochaeta TaxID=301207 RepID=A0ACB6S0W3_9PLEO|nr:HET-domain-containing protein [Macroventuria anomochaeta]KAF2627583.1 HET-domain-containing protein [Macroventuria anomochaeta]
MPRVPPHTEEELSTILREHSVKSQFGKRSDHFLPRGELDRLITRDSILAELEIKEENADEAEDLIDFILQKARRLFAIVVYIRLPRVEDAMLLFQANDFHDARLPIEEWTRDVFEAKLRENIEHPFIVMQGVLRRRRDYIWSRSYIYDFQKRQWEFLAPIISTEETNDCHNSNAILPFITQYTNLAEGSFGVVSKYAIHPDHIYIGKGCAAVSSNIFAIKEIKVDIEEDRHKVAEHWSSEVRTLLEMNKLKQEHIVRFITAFRYGKLDDPDHFLVFEWADGGNLSDLWKEKPHPVRTSSLTKTVIGELLGLAKALNAVHNMSADKNYRHGDLKPANILWFRTDDEFGTLKIGDWGEAKVHFVNTEARLSNTSSKFGTRRYEPPENDTGLTFGDSLQAETVGQKRRSRLYDIWAIGCIALEVVIWLLYGNEELERFNLEVQGDHKVNSPFYQVKKVGALKTAEVHRIVTHWIQHMLQDIACRPGTTALGDVLEIIQTGLLVVKLPQAGGRSMSGGQSLRKPLHFAAQTIKLDSGDSIKISVSPEQSVAVEESVSHVPSIEVTPAAPTELVVQPDPMPHRETAGAARILAEDLLEKLHHVVLTDEESYWYTEERFHCGPTKLEDGPPLSMTVRSKSGDTTMGALEVKIPAEVDYAHPPLDPVNWVYEIDNVFACTLFKHLRTRDSLKTLTPSVVPPLCEKCNELRDSLWQSRPSIGYSPGELKDSRTLSLYRGPDAETSPATEIQIGLPQLPEAGSRTHLDIVQEWLHDCDRHRDCARQQGRMRDARRSAGVPTRLIDVGIVGDQSVHLQEENIEANAEWVALSHQWGPPPYYFTETSNVDSRKSGIKLADLPKTFRDAVAVTRALKRRYLWIDSICIIQGHGGDFHSESKRMEDVYSGAYCVLAASCATGHDSGFLQPRRARDYVTVSPKGSNTLVYICESIDNFKDHVLNGALNRRGWVLQEHALARRTIFFTEYQTYFECGRGVRCETMTKMSNKSAELLGDPNFPRILVKAPQGERILRYQELYQQYSRLGLSQDYDRPTAIDGLQQKLLRTMDVEGGFGVLEDRNIKGTLRRSLLWHRGTDTHNLERIVFPNDRAGVPSWSWMAYAGGKDNSGGIDYFNLDFDGFDWQAITSPWSRADSEDETNALIAESREYDALLKKGNNENDFRIILDAPAEEGQYTTRCIVLGIEKGGISLMDKSHYVLVIKPTDYTNEYERVGAGWMPGRCLRGEVEEVHVV